MWGLGVLELNESDMSNLVHEFVKKIDQANAMDIAQVINACHKLGWDDERGYLSMMERLGQLDRYNPQDISLTVWAGMQRINQVPTILPTLLGKFLAIRKQIFMVDIASMIVGLRHMVLRNYGRLRQPVV